MCDGFISYFKTEIRLLVVIVNCEVFVKKIFSTATHFERNPYPKKNLVKKVASDAKPDSRSGFTMSETGDEGGSEGEMGDMLDPSMMESGGGQGQVKLQIIQAHF